MLLFTFSQLSICLLVSSGIIVEQKMENLDCFLNEVHFPIFHFVTGCG